MKFDFNELNLCQINKYGSCKMHSKTLHEKALKSQYPSLSGRRAKVSPIGAFPSPPLNMLLRYSGPRK